MISGKILRDAIISGANNINNQRSRVDELNVFPVPDGDTGTNIIGTRHGEKLFETLMTREERLRSEDMGGYYRVAADNRDLNYDKFFTEGNEDVSKIEDYHSHNTSHLDVEGMKKQLLRLRFIREDLGLCDREKPREIRSE